MEWPVSEDMGTKQPYAALHFGLRNLAFDAQSFSSITCLDSYCARRARQGSPLWNQSVPWFRMLPCRKSCSAFFFSVTIPREGGNSREASRRIANGKTTIMNPPFAVHPKQGQQLIPTRGAAKEVSTHPQENAGG
jgi:hypothetical protein